MKTVNFLEALEANKKKRVKIVLKSNECGTSYWFGINELINKKSWNDVAVYSQWEIEPEVIEFDCEWIEIEREDNLFSTPFKVTPINPTELFTMRNLVGKKTKVTIEVLE